MRAILLLVALSVAAAGCTSDPAEPVEAAADAPAPADDAAAADAAPTPVSPASTNASDEAPATPAGPATAGATPPPPPPPPAPKPWELAATAELGWFVAVGGADVPADASALRQTDAEHCPDANFTLPGGATLLTLQVRAPAPGPDFGGYYSIIVTAPDGSETRLEPLMDATSSVPGQEAAASNTNATYETPTSGVWRLQAEPTGPTASTEWAVDIVASGASVEVPSDLALTPGCTGS